MTLQEQKDKIDILSKKSDIVNKKAILLLAISGGKIGVRHSFETFLSSTLISLFPLRFT